MGCHFHACHPVWVLQTPGPQSSTALDSCYSFPTYVLARHSCLEILGNELVLHGLTFANTGGHGVEAKLFTQHFPKCIESFRGHFLGVCLCII